jgi:hypothetical protein
MEPAFPGEALSAFLAIGYRLAERPAVRPEDVKEEVLLMFPRDAARRPLSPEQFTPDTVLAWRTSPPPQLARQITLAAEVARSLYG